MRSTAVRPATRGNWHDFVRLFAARGGPHYGWCTPFRAPQGLTSRQRRACMRRLVDDGTPVGVLAYRDGEPIGWCSIAPRNSYIKLARSRTMPRKTPAETPTWTVTCFFVARPHRKQGVSRALLEGAVAYARSQGSRVVEGYPFDTAGVTGTHFGHSSVFSAVK